MLRVTVELLPYGSEIGKRLLSEIHIANDGSGSHEFGNYMAKIHPEQSYTKNVVQEYPRDLHVNHLVYRALKYFYGDTNVSK